MRAASVPIPRDGDDTAGSVWMNGSQELAKPSHLIRKRFLHGDLGLPDHSVASYGA